ncbi:MULTISPECIES: hypothetical protein [Microbacterium]|uniref:Uncharacterized protein n=1 Tax=Microbacterium algihabitans TaxID=3075992 RepID=A0ABU3RSI2_9MICO|nr:MULTISPECIES: hypothetical protein [Microbacterium]MCD2168757.1 hypothetical protein [Microbacterium sp. JC 701]MDU0325841.1 hypothetical protein [Microbacterium sp. KSW2-21]
MTSPPNPWHPEPADGHDDDLPDVFDGLTAIDVVDGELVPRAPAPPRA